MPLPIKTMKLFWPLNVIYNKGYGDALAFAEKHYEAGFSDGKKAAEEEHESKKRLLVTFEDEVEMVEMDIPKLARDEQEDLKLIVNMAEYEALRKYLLKQAVAFYVSARGNKHAEALFIAGDYLKEIVLGMDTLRMKAPEVKQEDPYAV